MNYPNNTADGDISHPIKAPVCCTTATAAKEYQTLRGWSPIPLKPRDKRPAVEKWQDLALAPDEIDRHFLNGSNIGVALGPCSNNLLDVDIDDRTALRLAPGFLSETGTISGRTGNPKSHWFYESGSGDTLRRKTYVDPDGTMLVEIRGEGHQTMVPPSIHPNGERLAWDRYGSPGRVTVVELMRAVGVLAAAAMLARHWPEWDHRRHTITLALTGGLLRAGWTEERIESFVHAVCEAGGDTDWEDRRKAIASTVTNYEAVPDAAITGFPTLAETIGKAFVDRLFDWLALPKPGTPTDEYTNTGNAERLVNRHGGDLRYDSVNKEWLRWDGSRWGVDRKNTVVELATESARSWFDDAKTAKDPAKVARHAMQSLNRTRLDAAIHLARSKPGVAVVPDELDRDPWAFNVMNGTLNLMTGGLQPHDRGDLLTKLAPVMYDPRATAPTWETFLSRAMGDDTEMVAFLQRLTGYLLTGRTDEQIFVFLYGLGGNGKSTFAETLMYVMGDYAGKVPTGVLMAKRYGSDPTDLEMFPGLRLAVTNELPKGGVLNDALIKDLTGGDRLVARKRYGHPFEFEPTHTIMMYGNEKPTLTTVKEAMRRRVVLVPFDVHIPEAERIDNLKDVLQREAPGILAWAVQGVQEYRRVGLALPEKVQAATRDYLDEQDPVKRFLADCTEFGKREKRDALYDAYKGWARENGEPEKTRRELMKDLSDLGILETRSNGVVYRSGIRLTGRWAMYATLRDGVPGGEVTV